MSSRISNGAVAGIIFLAVLILASPFLFFNVPFGELSKDGQYHLELTEQEVSFPVMHDALGYGGRPVPFSLYYYFFHQVPREERQKAMLGASLVSALLTVFLLFAMLQHHHEDSLLNGLMVSLYVVSPLFLYTWLIPSPEGLALACSILAFFLLERSKFLSVPLFFLIPFISIKSAIACALGLWLFYFYVKKTTITLPALFLGSSILLVMIMVYSPLGMPEMATLSEPFALQHLITDFGATMGFPLFMVLLCGIGLFLTRKKKYAYLPAYMATLIMAYLAIILPTMRIYAQLFVAGFAGFAFAHFIRRPWKIPLVSILFLVIISLNLVQQAGAYGQYFPLEKERDAMVFLQSLPPGIVFSHPDYGFLITSIGQHEVFMDNAPLYAPQVQERQNTTSFLFYSRNLEDTRQTLDQNKISFIFISKDMKEGKVWAKPDQGLLFLLRNNQAFAKVYDSNGMEIWQVKEANRK